MAHLFFTKLNDSLRRLIKLYHPRTLRENGWVWAGGILSITYVVVTLCIGVWWSFKPGPFDVRANASAMAQAGNTTPVTGYTTTATIIHCADTLLKKSGGYLSNDIAPPGMYLDNVHNWEFGVLVQIRDMVRVLRNDISRSQSQSVEDTDLANAEPQFNFQNDSWIFPSSEGAYQEGIDGLRNYLERLSNPEQRDAQFFARADNLRDWLTVVQKRLGSLSQRLSASVGQVRINTDLAGDAGATQSTTTSDEVEVKTPWLEVDDVFYEARGTTWALIHFLQAVEIDFEAVLKKKNALPSIRQIIRDLESTQDFVWSPMVLNGGGFGVVTNYSLVMANYISRANAAVIDLGTLLQQG